MTTSRFLVCLIISLTLVAGASTAGAQNSEVWILVDTRELTLTVLQGSRVRRSYDNVSIGRAGATADKRRGDGKTPLGEFRIDRVSTDTPFHRFFGLGYPGLKHAERALQTGTISRPEYLEIRRALWARRTPPQGTALGGYIGIHGVGAGDGRIHEDFNWTNGCIALTNEQIDDLAQWIRLGMRVILH